MEDDLTRVTQDSARGSFFLISGAALATVITAIGSILVARFLGPDIYGQYALAIVAPELLYLFTDLGLNQAIIKFAATLRSRNESERIPSIVKHGMVARAAIGITIFVLNYVLADTIATHLLQRPDLGFYIQIASTAILFRVIFTTATSAFIGLDKTEYQAVTSNIQALAKAIASITLILFGFSILGALAGYTLSFLGAAFVSLPLLWLLMRQNKIGGKGEGFKKNLRDMFHYGSPLYVCVLIVGFFPFLMNVILAFFVSDAEIGNFKAAVNFAALLTVLAEPITNILLSAFSKLNHISAQKIGYFFQITLKYTTIVVVPVTSLIMIFSTEIVQIIYGSTYQLTPLFLSTYIIVYLLAGIGYLTLPSFFNGLGKPKTSMKMNLIRFFALLILAVPLTQIYGVQGIIVAFIISLVAGTLYGVYIARKKYNVDFRVKNILKIYLISGFASIFPLLLINFTSFPNELKLVLGSVFYVLVFITLIPLTNLISFLELQKINLALRDTPFVKQVANVIVKYMQKILRFKANFKDKHDF